MTTSTSRAVVWAAAVVAALASCGLVGRLFWTSAGDAVDAVLASGPDSPSDLLVLAASGTGVGLTAWLALGVTVSALAALPGAAGDLAGAVADRLAPHVVRRAVSLLLGGGLLASAVPAVAHASAPPPRPPVATASPASLPPAPDPAFAVTGRVPAAPTPPSADGEPHLPTSGDAHGAVPYGLPVAPGLGPLGAVPRAGTATAQVTVVRGDSLWRIAARHLGAGATDARVALEWPRWYAANRALIGPDPDVIRAGQVLSAPSRQDPSS